MTVEDLRERCQPWAIRNTLMTRAEPFPQMSRRRRMVLMASSGAKLALDNNDVSQRARGSCGARGAKRHEIVKDEPCLVSSNRRFACPCSSGRAASLRRRLERRPGECAKRGRVADSERANVGKAQPYVCS